MSTRGSTLALLLLLTACATRHEALGNQALGAGDVEAAAAAYDLAMGDRPIMDFEYERIRKQRQRMMEGEWSPRLDALVATAPQPATPAHVKALVELRKEARAAGIPQSLAERIDAELVAATTAEALRATSREAVPARLEELLALFDTALESGAPQAAVDAILAAYAESLGVGLPAAGPDEGLARLAALLDRREAIRGRQFPTAVDTSIDAELAHVGVATFPAATPDESVARFEETRALRRRARALGAPAPALALVDRAHEDALRHILAGADADAAAHRYVTAYDRLARLAEDVEPGHPLLARLAVLARDGTAWHEAEAAALPTGYRQLLHLSLADALSAADSATTARVSARRALEPAFATAITLQPTYTADASCAGMGDLVTPTLARDGRKVVTAITLSRCVSRESDALSTRNHDYVTEELYYVPEQVRVGTDYERVEVGTERFHCVKTNETTREEYDSVCSRPVYESREIPIYETRQIEKRRDVPGTVAYEVKTRTVRVEAEGVATLTWDDGTALSVPFSHERDGLAEGWHYAYPGRRVGADKQFGNQAIPASIAVGPMRQMVGTAIGTQVSEQLLAKVRAHRARLAREEGARALAAGDDAAAGEAFVRSILHGGSADAEAAVWIESSVRVNPRVAEFVLRAEGSPRVPIAGAALPVPEVYTPAPIVGGEGAVLRSDTAVKRMVKEGYEPGIKPPYEFGRAHLGFVMSEIQTGPNLVSRGAPSMGFDLQFSPLELATRLRYGPVVHDELGLRFTIGGTYADSAEENTLESALALTFNPTYALYAGLRLPYFGVFAGASAGYLHATSNDIVAFGYHVEPAVRVTARLFGTQNLIVEASGVAGLVPGVAHKNRIAVSFPALGRHGLDVKLSVERALLPARERPGESWSSLGVLPVNTAGVEVGARF
ncbi:MAG: hypothetical protein V4850_14605 [Myxococcota bacterium]